MPLPNIPPPGTEKFKEPPPKSLREVPRFLKNVVGKFFGHLGYILKLVWQTGHWITLSMLAIAVLQGVLPVATAKIGAQLLNLLANGYQAAVNRAGFNMAVVATLLLLQFICIFVTGILSRVNMVVTRIAGELVVNHVTVMMIQKSKEVDLQSYDKPEFYERLENAGREAGIRPIQILNALLSAVSAIISMVSFFAILCSVNAAAPFLILLLALPSAVVSFVYRKKNFAYVRRRSTDRRQLAYYSGLLTNKDMVKEIKIFGLSETFEQKYNQTFQKYFKGLKRLYLKEGAWNIAVSLVSALVNCLLFYLIAKMVLAGQIMVGDYSLYTGALNAIVSGVNALISALSTIYEGTLFIDNLITYMNEKQTVVPTLNPPAVPQRHTGHKIELLNVSFRYPHAEKYVIRHLSCVIEPGSTVVLVGLNGAGKTTLIKLITRLYDPTEGEILLDGRNLKEYDLAALYSLFGTIFQDFGKYAVSAGENISFGQVDRPPEPARVRQAALQADADEFIGRLPSGYRTQLTRYFDENGMELSIGQWQKLSIARAFYSDSDILILDEPTASLDAIAEQEVYSQFDSLRQNKTTIFVSHRLSSATVADQILVLQNGELAERGTHAELMAKKGAYYKLFTTQARRYQKN